MIEIDDARFKEAINIVAGTEEGRVVLATLKDSCGWDQIYLSSDDPQVTQYFAARRGVYGSLRQFIKTEYLKKIEFDYKKKVAKHDDRPASKHSNTSRRAAKPATTGV